MVYRFIDNNKDYFGLRWLCRKFGISPNGYYNYLKNTKGEYHEQREVIYERIKYIYYNNNRTVGHRAMRVFLARYGIHISKTTVHKYMNKTLNLAVIIMRKKPGYTAGKKHKIFNNLLCQNFTVDHKNKVWCTDFTYMRQPNGRFKYNCTIIDLFDRSAISSVNSDYINTDLAKETLKIALKQEKYPKNLILHSDQGQQFASWEFVLFCKEQGITQSMSKAGYPYDNTPMERFFNTFKSCFYYRFTFESVEMLDKKVKEIRIIPKTKAKFFEIQYGRLQNKLQYFCDLNGIKFVKQEESYTSKASFWDKDIIPVYNNDNPKEYEFRGSRVKRGLYKTSSGKIFNADVNGALNIMRKSRVVDMNILYSRGEVDTPIRIRIA